MSRPLDNKQDTNKSSSSPLLPVADDNTYFAYRRCSLEHAKQNSARKLDATDTDPSHHSARRSSMKTSSTSGTGASRVKNVTFGLNVQVRPIAAKSDEENQACWLSKEERHQIQLQCNADLEILKRIAKSPEATKNVPEMRAVRSSISIRGLEQFSSKRLHRALLGFAARSNPCRPRGTNHPARHAALLQRCTYQILLILPRSAPSAAWRRESELYVRA